jgi:hypothetical protein
MYKIDIGRGRNKMTKYFLSWSEAKSYCTSLGGATVRIKSVH